MIKGAIFDFDGTLFDSMYIWDSIGETYLRSVGYQPRADLSNVLKSMSLYQAACYFRSEYSVCFSTDEIINGVNRIIERFYQNAVQPKREVKALLELLQTNGVALCLATATDRYLIEAALKRCEMDGFFSEIFTCASVGHGKDEPLIFRAALAHLGTTRADTLVFEDALHAIRTAKDDGFMVVGVYDDSEKNQAAVMEQSDFYLSDYSNANQFWREVSAHQR